MGVPSPKPTKRVRPTWPVAVLAVALAGGAAALLLRTPRPAEKPDADGRPREGEAADAPRQRPSRPADARPRPKPAEAALPDDREGMSEADRRLSDAVQAALDAEDFARTRDAARKAGRSANAEVRLQTVEALGWFGQKALVDLVPFMGDPDKAVAKAAADAWEFGLMEVIDPGFKFTAAHEALKTVGDPDALSMIGAQFAAAATERIDAADGAAAERLRVQAVQALVDLMEAADGTKRAEVSRELYEEITGQRWLGLDEAERYLQDPEGYEPPEDVAPEDAARWQAERAAEGE